tara:strand:+ start:806 stop:1861 length:1056 start_codon:yes stop_codon:yes gene_type:complete
VIRRNSLLTAVFLHFAFLVGTPGGSQASILGDSNGDNRLNIADPVYLLNHLYREGSPSPADSRPDANCDGAVSLSDAIILIEYFFLDGEAPGDFCSREIPAGLAYQRHNEQGFAEFEHRETGILFVLLPGGDFLMGTPEDEEDRWQDESPLHLVTLSAFLVGKYEVTQAQWEGVMGANPSFFQGDALAEGVESNDLPVERVSWDDVVEFTVLSGFSLPSEAQWEYACRGGSSGPFAGTGVLADMGWYVGNSGGRPHAVGSRLPNAFGLYDLHGNLYEWCGDVYNEDFYASEGASGPDPVYNGAGDYHVVRGGGWFYEPVSCRSGNRYAISSLVSGNRRLGLRPVIGLLGAD